MGGNMRLRAAKELKYSEVPVIVMSGLTPEEEREIVVKDNGENFGEFDFDLLANNWSDEPLKDWGVDLPADWLKEEETVGDAEPQIDKAESLNKVWQVKPGDLWRIGEHQLLCGDSTKKEDVDRVMGEFLANLIWTDPPYGIKYGQNCDNMPYKKRSIKNDNLPLDKTIELINGAYKLASEYSAKGCAIYAAAAAAAGDMLNAAIDAFKNSGFMFKWQLVWVKDSLVLSRSDYHFRHENILYGWKEDGAHYFIDDRKQDSVFEYARPKKSEEHPMMKPVDLVMHMIKNSSKIGNLVYDPFLGSGTTMVACQNLNRKCRGIEISPQYVAVCLERMFDAFGIKGERIE
jgi:DNA modification methylase